MQTLRLISIYAFILAGFAALLFFSAYADEPEPAEQPAPEASAAPQDGPEPLQTVRPPKLPDALDFAGEPVPIDDWDTRERIDREMLSNCYWHSSTLLLLKRANRYFPIIEKILKEEGLPEDLKYLCVTESNLSNATSPAGAKGFWQFMPATARGYGLEVSSDVDERYHLEKATRAACKYLKAAKADFGSWMLAAAAYNMGQGGLRKRLAEQKQEKYFDLNLNNETSRYVPRIVALKEIMQRPEHYGFFLEKDDLYAPLGKTRVVEVSSSIVSWGTFANEQGVSYRQLKAYNPWLVDSDLSNKTGKTYYVHLPQK